MGILTDETRRFLAAIAPEYDAAQVKMTVCADEHGFPTTGPEAGGVLRVLARLAGATRLPEFGSGFGYFATWFVEGMVDDAELFLIEHDTHELGMAWEFPDRAGFAGRVTFLEGDVPDLFEGVNGELDLVLLDHQRHRYVEAPDLISDRVAVGGVIIANNVMRGPVSFGVLTDWSEGWAEALDGTGADTCGVAAFLDVVRADPRYEIIALPVGSGLATSTRTE